MHVKQTNSNNNALWYTSVAVILSWKRMGSKIIIKSIKCSLSQNNLAVSFLLFIFLFFFFVSLLTCIWLHNQTAFTHSLLPWLNSWKSQTIQLVLIKFSTIQIHIYDRKRQTRKKEIQATVFFTWRKDFRIHLEH